MIEKKKLEVGYSVMGSLGGSFEWAEWIRNRMKSREKEENMDFVT